MNLPRILRWPGGSADGWKHRYSLVSTSLGLLVLLAFGSCFDQPDRQIRFKIPSGHHYSLPRIIEPLRTTDLKFRFKFDTMPCSDDQINKLFGFTDCNSTVHENSARFGFIGRDSLIAMYAYVYRRSERIEAFMGFVRPYEWNEGMIRLKDGVYEFELSEKIVQLPRYAPCHRGYYQLLMPYYGGRKTCDRDIFISLAF
jgi:hypothetical protein